MGPLFKKIALIGHTECALVTVSNVSCQFMHNPEQEILQRFSFFSYQLPAVHGDDVIMPPAIVVFPQVRYNYYIILTDYSSWVQK